MMTLHKLLSVAALLLPSLPPAAAQTDSIAPLSGLQGERARTWAFGPSHMEALDTYLTDEHFTANFAAATALVATETGSPSGKVTRLWTITATAAVCHDRSRDRKAYAGYAALSYGLYWRLPLSLRNVSVSAGGTALATVGCIWTNIAGNNPGQAIAELQIMPSVKARYSFRAIGLRQRLDLRADLPLAGIEYSPRFGQSYYENFTQGDYDRNVVATTLVSAPRLRAQLLWSAKTGSRHRLVVGWLGDFVQSKANNIRRHLWTHSVLVGWQHDL